MDLELDQQKISEYADLELRGAASAEQVSYLEAHRQQWIAELTVVKRRAETQMTSSKAKTLQLHCDLMVGTISPIEFNDALLKEKVWRTNASRFLQQIEMRLSELKNYA